MSRSRTNTRSRLVAAAQQIHLLGNGVQVPGAATGELFHAEPSGVFAHALLSLRDRALSAEQWSNKELKEFGEQLAVLVAGLRANAQRSDPDHAASATTNPCEECEEELARCQQPDPETGQPHLDCFMVYAACLFRCTGGTF
jgi:hypothetical protein